MSRTSATSRRAFLRQSAATGASLLGGLSLGRSAHAAGSDTLKVALIGCGGRGTGAAANCLNVADHIRLVAVADVFPEHAQAARRSLANQYGDRVDIAEERVFVGLDVFRQAIQCDVDLVILATPPGFVPVQYRAAVDAGKHVFMEPPLAIDAPGFRRLMAANRLAESKGLNVGVGLHRRHEAGYQETIKRVHEGDIGDVRLLRVYGNQGSPWLRPRQRGDTELLHQIRNWRFFSCFGGDPIVHQHVHHLDVANWVTARRGDPKAAHPIEAQGAGGRARRDEQKGTGHTYDHHFVEFTYADGTKLFGQCREMDGCWNQTSEAAQGLRGTANCSGLITGERSWSYSGPRPNPYDQEHADLIQAIRKGEKYHEGWFGAISSMTAVLGRMATYSGQVVRWDDAVADGASLLPDRLAPDAPPPSAPDAQGSYRSAVAVPGVYKPY